MTQERLSQKMDFFIEQENNVNCGPACIQMLLLKAGIKIEQHKIAKILQTNGEGTEYQNILSFIVDNFSDYTVIENAKLNDLDKQLPKKTVLTSIVYDSDPDKYGETEKISHYSLVDRISDNVNTQKGILLMLDPSAGVYELEEDEFVKTWEKWFIAVNTESLAKVDPYKLL